MSRFPRARHRSGRSAAVVAAAVASLVAGCGAPGGRVPLSPDAPSTMTVTSAAFGSGVLPQRYTCYGARSSPPVDWSGAPPGTRSYALVVDDSAAPITPYIYWLVFDIPATTTLIAAGSLPPGARQAEVSDGRVGYDPPCPHGASHSYRITVYALSSWLNLPNGAATRRAWMSIAAAAIGRGRITVVASPPSRHPIQRPSD